MAKLSNGKVFTELDANSRFWQVPIAEDSRLLTTFITPIGRFCFNKLPFGINSAPEHFQRRMSSILDSIPGVLCNMDDILVFGENQEVHDKRLLRVLERLKGARVTLNEQKCDFSKTGMKFLGHIISAQGIEADPDKISAIVNMSPPTDITSLRRFLGMVNHRETVVSADASSYGIGSVLLQKFDNKLHPVAFASRSLTPTEQRYAKLRRKAWF